MRSAEAAKNTAILIEGSVTRAEEGVAVNQEVLTILQEMNGEIRKVTEVMAEIAEGSNQQERGVDQINTAVSQMNQITQHTAASSEESASDAQELASQATEMQNMIAMFQLAGSGSIGHRRVETRPEGHHLDKPSMLSKKPASPAVNQTDSGVIRNAKELIPFSEADRISLTEF